MKNLQGRRVAVTISLCIQCKSIMLTRACTRRQDVRTTAKNDVTLRTKALLSDSGCLAKEAFE